VTEKREGELLPREADAAIERELDHARPIADSASHTTKVVVLKGPAAAVAAAAVALALPLFFFIGTIALILLIIILPLILGIMRSWPRVTRRKT
jgi:hypothetical protein